MSAAYFEYISIALETIDPKISSIFGKGFGNSFPTTSLATGLEPTTTLFLNEPIGFESRCSHLKFRYLSYSEQGGPWHSGNYSVWIHTELRTWKDKNIQVTSSIKNFVYDLTTQVAKQLTLYMT